jgi:hypothetical protein
LKGLNKGLIIGLVLITDILTNGVILSIFYILYFFKHYLITINIMEKLGDIFSRPI